MNLPNFQICEQDISEEILTRYLSAEAIAVDTETMGLIPMREGKGQRSKYIYRFK